MLNLYEILEVSEKASKEVVDKAYHVLVKKYHPDLQQENDKKIAEEQMKKINEAYEILSDEEKRKQYDLELARQREEQKRIEEIKRVEKSEPHVQTTIYKENDNLERLRQENIKKQEYDNMKKIQNEMQRVYAQAYNDYLRSRGYKIKEPWTLKRFIELLKVLAILAIIIAVIWFFPPTHNLLIEFYEGNVILKAIIDVIINIIIGLWEGIINFFKSIF